MYLHKVVCSGKLCEFYHLLRIFLATYGILLLFSTFLHVYPSLIELVTEEILKLIQGSEAFSSHFPYFLKNLPSFFDFFVSKSFQIGYDSSLNFNLRPCCSNIFYCQNNFILFSQSWIKSF